MRKTLFLFCLLLLIPLEQTALAQQPSNTTPQTPVGKTDSNALPSTSVSNQKYRIWPGDVLDVRVFDHPELSHTGAVDALGMIRLPQIAEEIQAACRTESELAAEIVARYKPQGRYHVYVRIIESKAPPVTIRGGVPAPQSFHLRRPLRLMEALALAGGTTDSASGEIRIKRSQALSCEISAPEWNGKEEKIIYVKDLMRGEESANPYLQPGDIITVSEVDKVYVAGSVLMQTTLRLRMPLTVSQAIAKAGGILPSVKSERVQICRQINGGSEVKIINVELREVRKGKAQDMLLQAEDVVYVPLESGIGGPPFCYPRPKKDVPEVILPKRPIY